MKRLAWLAEWVVLGLAAALVTLWLSLWLGWLLRHLRAGQPGPVLVPALLFVLVVSGAQVTRRALQQPQTALRRTRLVVGATGAGLVVGATLLAVPAILGGQPWYLLAGLFPGIAEAAPVFLGFLYAWWAGIRLGRAPVGHHILAGAFYGGVFALALLLVANTFLPAFAGPDVLLPVLLYFALGLCGLALTSLRRLRAQQRTVTLTQVALTRYWVVTAVAVIGLVVFVGLLSAQLLAPESVRQLADLLDLGLRVALTGIALLVTPAFLLLFAVLGPLGPALARAALALLSGLQRLAELLRGLIASLLRGLAGSRVPRLFDEERLEQFINSPAVQAGGRWGLVLLFVLLALVVFWLAVRRFNRLSANDTDEIRDSVFSMPLLLSQLRRLFHLAPRRAPPPRRYLLLAGAPDDARLIVRRAYQAMLEWAQSASLPRAAGQTPRAYAEVLAGAVPHEREAIGALTSAYLVARYAPEAPSLEQARRAESAVARLRQVAPEAVAHA